MNRVLGLVGRSPECLVFVQHKSLSRLHCSLVRTPLGLWVVDLLSRKGTYYNGNRVRCARIQEGDVVKAGKFSLRFWYPPPPTQAVPQLAYKDADQLSDSGSAPGNSLEPVRFERPARAVQARGRPTQLAAPSELSGTDGALLLNLVNQFGHMQQQMFDQFQESLFMATRLFASLHQEQMSTVRRELDQLQQLTSELRTLQQQVNQPAAPAEPAASASESVQPTAEVPTVPSPADKTATPASGPVPPAANEEIHDWLTQRISSLQEERQTRWNKLLGLILGP
jgi:hypothetical protein